MNHQREPQLEAIIAAEIGGAAQPADGAHIPRPHNPQRGAEHAEQKAAALREVLGQRHPLPQARRASSG
ncbi:hypothetical protein DL768_006295 [Monosporascus sp. mg162]|nr:hypothetical protein DL768_006295 [Monosporascus sp. mg162]